MPHVSLPEIRHRSFASKDRSHKTDGLRRNTRAGHRFTKKGHSGWLGHGNYLRTAYESGRAFKIVPGKAEYDSASIRAAMNVE
jgi:hypothetical protein